MNDATRALRQRLQHTDFTLKMNGLEYLAFWVVLEKAQEGKNQMVKRAIALGIVQQEDLNRLMKIVTAKVKTLKGLVKEVAHEQRE